MLAICMRAPSCSEHTLIRSEFYKCATVVQRALHVLGYVICATFNHLCTTVLAVDRVTTKKQNTSSTIRLRRVTADTLCYALVPVPLPVCQCQCQSSVISLCIRRSATNHASHELNCSCLFCILFLLLCLPVFYEPYIYICTCSHAEQTARPVNPVNGLCTQLSLQLTA